MTAYATHTGSDTLRVVVTGAFEGEADLRDALEAHHGEVEVLAWGASPLSVAAELASPDLSAVLHGTLGIPTGGGEAILASLEAEVNAIRRHTRVPVILLVPDAEPALVESAFAAGVDDVLVLPQMADTIAFAIRKARAGGGRHAGASGEPRGQVITIFSPKGGTGKTVLSTNLAALLATKSDQRVLLIDLDLQFGDAAIMLGVDPERTLYELVLAPGELDAGKLRGFTTRHKSGLEILAAPMRPEEAELVTESKVLRLLEVARLAYDVVVIDTSPFFYGPMLALLEPTDYLLLLCGLDVPTLKNVRLSLRTLELLGFPRTRTNLVLNRVTSKVGVTSDDVEAALELPVRFEIPNDPVVAPSVNRGTPAVLQEGDSPFAQAVSEIAAALRPTPSPVTPRAAETGRWRLFDGKRRRLLEGRA